MRVIRAGVAALRAVGLTVVLIAGLLTGTAVTAAAADVENLMVPSAAMGRDIPVTFLGGVRMRSFCWTRSTGVMPSATG